MHATSELDKKYASPAMSMSSVAMETAAAAAAGMNMIPRFYGDSYNSFYGSTGYSAAMGMIGK